MDTEGCAAWDMGSIHPRLPILSEAIDCYPAEFTGNPLHLLFLNGAERIERPQEFLRQLDAPPLMDERRQYVSGDLGFWPFPTFDLSTRPDPWLVSQRLFERFDEARRFLNTQTRIGRIIESKVKEHEPDVVTLVIADGLSYYDLPEGLGAEPCLVNGASITEVGYLLVIGRPEVSRLLFAAGYREQIGFTYYSPDPNSLAAQILSRFADSQTVRVNSFDEILAHLSQTHMGRSYVQIAMPGLDQLCHAHHDEPPRDYYLQQILQRFDRLIACLAKRGRRVLAFLTADHGILWREHIEGKVEVVGDLLPEDARHVRHVQGHFIRDYGRCCTNFGQHYTLLRAPCMTRNLKSNEWGVHGGISAWESIVPLLMKHV